GGRTDIDNLVLVCTSCHHNIHDDGWEVIRRNDGAHELRPPPKPYALLRPWQAKPATRFKDSDPFPETGVSTTRPTNLQPVLLN
ncbi:MAG: HNH endonuclease, partial [Acidimicrobiia bacterium]|nr:HNH endonuclease [Acidimicrobiia bacterium]